MKLINWTLRFAGLVTAVFIGKYLYDASTERLDEIITGVENRGIRKGYNIGMTEAAQIVREELNR